jgi:ferredoxin-nitrate reductase
MHWGALWAENSEANSLTHPAACPISLQPELKACAVKLIPLKSLVNAELSPSQFLATP